MVLRHSGQPAAVLSSRHLDGQARGGGVLDRLTRLASRLLNTPGAAVSLVGDDRQVFLSAVGEPPGLAYSPCRHVVEADAPLIIGDIRADGRVRDRAELTAL